MLNVPVVPFGAAAVDVVVPVYNGYAVVRRCIESVLACPQETAFELLVVDDASTDPETVRYLNVVAADGKVTLLRNESNRGFVRSANRGLQMHADRDVVLLNSDTEVANDWLDRLRASAYSEPDIGTATPFSNNATICSFPVFCADNLLPDEVGLAQLDAVFATVNTGKTLSIPTAVGFCMYLRRACVDQVGIFDEQRFGRGYGEENDFCRRAIKAGWSNVLCADTFVFHSGNASFQSERETLTKQAEPVLLELHPDYLDDVHAFIRRDPAASLRRAVEIELARHRLAERASATAQTSPVSAAAFACRSPATLDRLADMAGQAVQLHVLHDLGGGIERWCRDYCRADTTRANLILRPFCRGHAAGEGLMLFAHIDDQEPIGLWVFATPFEVTAVTHPEYAGVVRSIIADYRVGALLVSSLIGHSLDVLTTGVPTVFIAHDYFPACPAINLYFDGVCQQCDDARLVECSKDNPDYNPFVLFAAEERLAVRKRFLAILESGSVAVVVASRIVSAQMQRLFPTLNKATWVHIPHGADGGLVPIYGDDAPAGEKLRLVVLGMLSVNKGMRLLADALDRLSEFAEVHLLGAQEVGEIFLDRPGVHVVTRYTLDELQGLMQRIRPHAGMLLSILPETFSYTLTELIRLGVPPVATRLGSFAERIIDGETGFLIEPNADALLDCLRKLNADRDALERVRRNLTELPARGAAEMVADYHRLLPLSAGAAVSADGYPAPAADETLAIRQATALVAMWKQIKSLDLQLTMSREARPRAIGPGQVAEHQRLTAERQRDVAEHQRAIAEHQRTVAEHHRAVAEQQRAMAEVQFNQERQRWADRLDESARVLLEREKALAEKNGQVEVLRVQLGLKDKQLEEILASSSWRLTGPLRTAGNVVRRLKLLVRCLLPALREPASLPAKAKKLVHAWQLGGLLQLKLTLLAMQADVDHQDAWKIYRRTFETEVRPRIVAAIEQLPERPLISIIVPTYNTQKAMLRHMIESVQGQLYPNWELCIADDCSSESHVRKILKDYAKNDARIKLHFGEENRGVSFVSNRALEVVSGQFVVLLDHDDVLEEQALFRIAEALLSDQPDMIYSDEIMVSADMNAVLQYAYRPAFSPEFLRGHPYIVHMVGFRTELLRAVGGFNEELKISQDYDLILRVTEQARAVVHIPEILYQWRIHGGSAGKQKMDDVMCVSKSILQRHLDRCGVAGTVNDGAGFNLFDVRYPLKAGLRVAIIIPTKNHGELVRQCIDSIRATVREVAYDIMVVDHESDDPATIAYLASIADRVKVVRYAGPFNFSAINNWAVGQLDGGHTHYLFCNNDIEAIESGWLERMLELCQREDIGIVGAQLLYPDRMTIQHAGVCVGAFGAAEHYAKFVRVPDVPRYLGFSEILRSNHEVSAVTAACMLIRKDAFDEVSGFDEGLAVGFGDVDLCLRVGHRGYRVLYCPHALLIHHESFTRGKTTGADPHPEDSAAFQTRWAGFLHAGDPYFNPGLFQNSVAWQMRQPMRCSFEVRRRVFRRIDELGRQSFEMSPC